MPSTEPSGLMSSSTTAIAGAHGPANGGQFARGLATALRACVLTAVQIVHGNDLATMLYQRGQQHRHAQAEQRRNEAGDHHCGRLDVEAGSRSDGVGIRGDDVAGLAATGERHKQRQFGHVHLRADFNGDGRDDQHRHGNEHTHGADDHRGERQRENRKFLTEGDHDGLGDAIGRTGFHHHPGQHARSKYTHHRAHHALCSRDYDVNGLRQCGTADDTSDHGTEHQRVGGVELT